MSATPRAGCRKSSESLFGNWQKPARKQGLVSIFVQFFNHGFIWIIPVNLKGRHHSAIVREVRRDSLVLCPPFEQSILQTAVARS